MSCKREEDLEEAARILIKAHRYSGLSKESFDYDAARKTGLEQSRIHNLRLRRGRKIEGWELELIRGLKRTSENEARHAARGQDEITELKNQIVALEKRLARLEAR